MTILIRWRERLFAAWATRCPLCEMTSRGGLLCAGCEDDWYAQRQRRWLCARCAAEQTPAKPQSQIHSQTQPQTQPQTDCSEISARPPAPPSLLLSPLAHLARLCHQCRYQPPPQSYACAALDYGFPARLLMVDFKQRGQLPIARPLAHLMLKSAQAAIGAQRPDVWVPVPASVQRLRRHGFSPPQQLAWHMSRFSGIAVRSQWLTWVRTTPQQKTLSRAERQTALALAMQASPAVAGQWIGVVDDVMTTGSTLSEAARALLAAGARGVTVIAAMRAP